MWQDGITQHSLLVLNGRKAARVDESTDESHIDLDLTSIDIAPIMDCNKDKDLHSSDHFPIHIIMYNRLPLPGHPFFWVGMLKKPSG